MKVLEFVGSMIPLILAFIVQRTRAGHGKM